ncbi:MAG: hypothetical protein WD749_09350 [Phycisphaerales bacterium]
MRACHWFVGFTIAFAIGGGVSAQPTPIWDATYPPSTSEAEIDRPVNVAMSPTHVYPAGTERTEEAGSQFVVIQYDIGDGTKRSEARFPAIAGTHVATCLGSWVDHTTTVGGAQYTILFVAGTRVVSETRNATVAAFHTGEEGTLELLWSASELVAADYQEEIPVAIMAGNLYVAVVSRLEYLNGNIDIVTRVYNITDGSPVTNVAYKAWSSSGTYEDSPIGVMLTDTHVIVGGHGRHSSGEQAMVVLAYRLSTGAETSAFFTRGSSSYTFTSTCMTSAPNSQLAAWVEGFAVAGRTASGSSTNGDWLVVKWSFNGTAFTADWYDFGKSTSGFDDVPVAMCAGLTPVNYDSPPYSPPIPAHDRLWVTGTRTPLSSGKSEITTVQYGMGGGTHEWFDHYQHRDQNEVQYDAIASSISAMDFGSGFGTRAYIGGSVESTATSGTTDYLILKYTSEPTDPMGEERVPIWAEVFPGLSNALTEVSTGSITNNYGGETGRVISITGWRTNTGTSDDFVTARYADDNQ